MKIMFRLANLSDIERICEIEAECFKEPYKRSDIEYEISKNPVNKFVLALDNNQIIGFIDFMITFNSATINQIAVTKDMRNKGVATLLLNIMETYFPKEGEDVVENVTLEVRKSNVPALNLYEKNKYEMITIKPHYYADGEDAVYMVKRLLLCR